MAKYKSTVYVMCNICGKELPQSAFYRDGSTRKGPRYRKECKRCYRERRAKREEDKFMEVFPIKHVEGDE